MGLALTDRAVRELDELLARVVEGKARTGDARSMATRIRERLQSVLQARAAKKSNPYQVPLPVILPAPARGSLRENDQFTCEHFGCTLLVRRCIERQVARWPGGNRLRNGAVREKKAGVHPYCAGGGCAQGESIARRCDYDPTAWWSKGRFRFYRPDSSTQRKKMRQARLESPDEAREPEPTPFAEAAALTPDDQLG